MKNPAVSRVNQKEVDEALVLLETIDLDAANILRARINMYRLFTLDLWELRDLALTFAHRLHTVAAETHETGIALERLARNEMPEQPWPAPGPPDCPT